MSTKKTGSCKKELEQAKESLISCETQHRNLIDYMRNGYAYCRMVEEEGHPVDFIHLEVNKGYEDLTGLNNVAGKRITEVLPGIAESNPEFLEKHKRVVDTGIPDQFEIYLETLKKWFDINVYSPQKGYTVAMIDDITRRKQNEEEQKVLVRELIAAKEKAVENDKWKTEFLANISHDIRTPISGIFGFSDLLKDPHLSKGEQVEYAGLIHKSCEQMLHLINNFIDISCIEAGEAKPQVSQTPVNELLNDICAFFKPQAEKKGLELRCSPGLPDNESTIETDNVKLQLILTNLVQNAMKFTGAGSIEIGYTKKENMLEFFVIDTGIGIPADKKEEIFERFRQVYDAVTANSGGSGLGLNISRQYVEMLGGTIWVESETDAGSKFVFTLPFSLKK